jgi:hypothetical protein
LFTVPWQLLGVPVGPAIEAQHYSLRKRHDSSVRRRSGAV